MGITNKTLKNDKWELFKKQEEYLLVISCLIKKLLTFKVHEKKI